MFIKQHTFLAIKSEITLLFMILFMHQLYYSELVVGWRAADMDANRFFLFWTAWWLDWSKQNHQKMTPDLWATFFAISLERRNRALPKLFLSVLARGPKKFRFFGAAFWMDWLEESRNQNTTDSSISFFDMSPTRINRALLKLFPSVLGSRPKAFVFV